VCARASSCRAVAAVAASACVWTPGAGVEANWWISLAEDVLRLCVRVIRLSFERLVCVACTEHGPSTRLP
jgi:hypothetical protein